MKKIRADILVVQQGIAESRAKAQAMILAGQILTTDGVRIEKAGQLLAEDSPLYFKGARLKFVSRGGLKLEGALKAFEKKGYQYFNVGTGIGTSVLNLIKTFGNNNNIDMRFKIDKRRPGDVGSYYCSPEKIKNQLDWDYQYSIDDACVHAYQYYIKNNKN